MDNIKNAFFRVGKNILGRFLACITGVCDFLNCADQAAKRRFFAHDVCVVAHIGGSVERIQQIPGKFQTGYFRGNILLQQTILQRDQVDRLSFIIQLHHRIKKNAELLLIKIIAGDNFRCGEDGIRIHYHRADDRLLRLRAVRHDTLDQRFFHNNLSFNE